LDEFNFFGKWSFTSIHGTVDGWKDYPSIPAKVLLAAKTGFPYSRDMEAYDQSMQDRGLLPEPIPYGTEMLEVISSLESLHLSAFLGRMYPKRSFRLDFPQLRYLPFPDTQVSYVSRCDPPYGELAFTYGFLVF